MIRILEQAGSDCHYILIIEEGMRAERDYFMLKLSPSAWITLYGRYLTLQVKGHLDLKAFQRLLQHSTRASGNSRCGDTSQITRKTPPLLHSTALSGIEHFFCALDLSRSYLLVVSQRGSDQILSYLSNTMHIYSSL